MYLYIPIDRVYYENDKYYNDYVMHVFKYINSNKLDYFTIGYNYIVVICIVCDVFYNNILVKNIVLDNKKFNIKLYPLNKKKKEKITIKHKNEKFMEDASENWIGIYYPMTHEFSNNSLYVGKYNVDNLINILENYKPNINCFENIV